MSWDVKKYKSILSAIKINGTFNGESVKSLEDIYDIISRSINVSFDTAKSWGRPTSTGPKDEAVLRDLEKLLGVGINSFSSTAETGTMTDMSDIKLSDFNKQAIYKMYELMKNYLHDEYDNEETFSKMWSEIQKLQLIVPDELYMKVSDFIDNNLAPIVYDTKQTFSNCFTDEIGIYNNEGIWQIRNEEALKQMSININIKIIEIEESLDSFAMNELRPYLM